MATRKLIKPKTFADDLGVSRSQLYVLMKRDPRFPKPVRISEGRIAFVEAEKAAYIELLIAERPCEAA